MYYVTSWNSPHNRFETPAIWSVWKWSASRPEPTAAGCTVHMKCTDSLWERKGTNTPTKYATFVYFSGKKQFIDLPVGRYGSCVVITLVSQLSSRTVCLCTSCTDVVWPASYHFQRSRQLVNIFDFSMPKPREQFSALMSRSAVWRQCNRNRVFTTEVCIFKLSFQLLQTPHLSVSLTNVVSCSSRRSRTQTDRTPFRCCTRRLSCSAFGSELSGRAISHWLETLVR